MNRRELLRGIVAAPVVAAIAPALNLLPSDGAALFSTSYRVLPTLYAHNTLSDPNHWRMIDGGYADAMQCLARLHEIWGIREHSTSCSDQNPLAPETRSGICPTCRRGAD